MNIPDKHFNRLLAVAKDRCNDLAERADHGESDFDDDVHDLVELIQVYDPKYVNPYDELNGVEEEEEEEEIEDDDEDNDEDDE